MVHFCNLKYQTQMKIQNCIHLFWCTWYIHHIVAETQHVGKIIHAVGITQNHSINIHNVAMIHNLITVFRNGRLWRCLMPQAGWQIWSITSQWIVPYNTQLVLNCHLNVEMCSSVKSLKYVIKYAMKKEQLGNVCIEQGTWLIYKNTVQHEYSKILQLD